MLRKVRVILGATVFLLITLLFLDFTGTMHRWFSWLAKIQFVPAVLALNFVVVAVLLLVTWIFGRVYCSIICPMGVFQDVVEWLHNRRKKNRYTYSKGKSWLRYTLLVLWLAAFAMGVGAFVALLAPYSSYGRIAANLFQPVWELGNNALAYLCERIDSYAFYSTDVWIRSMPTFVIATVTFVIVFVLAWRNGRTYCNTICPVGTLLSFVSRFSLFKVRFDADKCRSCSLCSKNCKASCIDFKTHTVDYSRCVTCGNCISNCKFGALSYSLSRKSSDSRSSRDSRPSSNPSPSIDSSKRTFLASSVMVTTALLAQEKKKFDGGLAKIEDKTVPNRQTPLTPPGSWSAENMARRCTGCQLCVSECPNDVLRPSTDLQKLMQPTMSYERGYCRPECTRCSEVCPTGAIKPIRHEQKVSLQIGHAVWIKKNCLPLTDGVDCGNCARHCPAGAIEMVPSNPNDEESPYVPAINEARCIGCGACEHLCPARPLSAIIVEGHEVHREI